MSSQRHGGWANNPFVVIVTVLGALAAVVGTVVSVIVYRVELHTYFFGRPDPISLRPDGDPADTVAPIAVPGIGPHEERPPGTSPPAHIAKLPIDDPQTVYEEVIRRLRAEQR